MLFARATSVATIAAVVFAAAASAADDIKLSAAQITALGIETAAPAAAGAGQLAGLPAQVVVPNEQQRVVSAPLAALVEQVLVATQTPVRRGQGLVQLQSPGLADLQHTYLQAATQLELARTQLERDEKLIAEGIIAESRLQATRSRWIEVSADYAERMQALRLAGHERRRDRRTASRPPRGQRDHARRADRRRGARTDGGGGAARRGIGADAAHRAGSIPLWLELQLPVARLADVREGATVRVPSADAEARVIVDRPQHQRRRTRR